MRTQSSGKRDIVNDIETEENVTVGIVKVSHSYWGWLASFLNIAMVDGVGYTTGLLLDSLLQDLGGGRGGVAVAGSLQVGVYSLSGPLVGKLIDRFGDRSFCIAGAFISCFGLFSASFATNLGMVFVG